MLTGHVPSGAGRKKIDLAQSIRAVLDPRVILGHWWLPGDEMKNWGDMLTPHLLRSLSGKVPIPANKVFTTLNRPVFTVCGSIIHQIDYRNAIVWGAGAISADTKIRTPPRRVYAVRGPLTRELLETQSIECPKVFGDPGLLSSRLFPFEEQKEYRLGVIPHYADLDHSSLGSMHKDPEVNVIDIRSGLKEVPKEVNKCQYIASSSLHGLILGDSYRIPSLWIELSDRVIGEGFKFRDYLLSVGRKGTDPLSLTASTSAEDVIGNTPRYQTEFDENKFLASCPFLNPEIWPDVQKVEDRDPP